MFETYNLGKFREAILAPIVCSPENTVADLIHLPDLMQYRAE